MKPIYNERGEIIDFSDEGEQAATIESNVNTYYLLKRLPPRQRQVVKLRMEGLSFKQIAVEMNIEISTAYYYKKLAKRKLSQP